MPIDWKAIGQIDQKYIEAVWAEANAELLYKAFLKCKSLDEWGQYLKENPPSPAALAICLVLGKEKYLSSKARKAADAKHSAPGGARNKAAAIQRIWASGKYTSRDQCASDEYLPLNMSYSAARKALRNTPDPRT